MCLKNIKILKGIIDFLIIGFFNAHLLDFK